MPGTVAHARVDVARHRDVDQHAAAGPCASAATSSSSSRPTIWCGDAGGARRRCRRARARRGRSSKRTRLAAEALRQADRAVVAAVGHEHRLARRGRAARARSARRSRRRRSRARARSVRSPRTSARQLDRHRGHRHARARRSPVSVRTRLPAASASRNSRFVIGPVDALDERQLVGALDLALDLGLADDHRVEPGGDAEQVARRRRCRAASRGAPSSSVGRMPGLAREHAERGVLGLDRVAGDEVELGAVAGGDRDGLVDARRARRARASTRAARPSGSASRSRSASGAVLCETPSASSSLSQLVAPRPARASSVDLALDARELRADDRDVDQDQGHEDAVGAGDVLAGLVERQRGHQRAPARVRLALGSSLRARRSASAARGVLGGQLELPERHEQQRDRRPATPGRSAASRPAARRRSGESTRGCV